MGIFNFGSLNLDFVYSVKDFVRPGETISAFQMEQHIGGKGLNQSIALARAGMNVTHAGFIGNNGHILKETLTQANVNTHFVKTINGPSGHAIIQVNDKGENSIIIQGGANLAFDEAYIDSVISTCEDSDVILLQNEINHVPLIMKKAKAKGLRVVFNTAPFTPAVLGYPLECVDLFIVNEHEGQALTKMTKIDDILSCFSTQFPKAKVVLTLGENGAYYQDNNKKVFVEAEKVTALDTTSAGDTFTGYFLTKWLENESIEQCLKIATRAAGICITKKGAAQSIPHRHEVE